MTCLEPQPGWHVGHHKVAAASQQALEEFNAFVELAPLEAQAAYERLSEEPLEDCGENQFHLRGTPFKSQWQLDATNDFRIWYVVDVVSSTVVIAAVKRIGSSYGELSSSRRTAVARVEKAITQSIREAVDTSALPVPDWAQPAHIQRLREREG